LRPTRIEQLTWFGVPGSSVQVLKDYLTILPNRTPVNLNTASAVVVFAAVPGIDIGAAQKLVAGRAQSPLQKLSDASNMLGLGTSLLESDFSIYSQYFEVRGRLRLGDWIVIEESLVQREGLNVTTVWRRRL
jgi:general secretion pathway protein K